MRVVGAIDRWSDRSGCTTEAFDVTSEGFVGLCFGFGFKCGFGYRVWVWAIQLGTEVDPHHIWCVRQEHISSRMCSGFEIRGASAS